MTISWNIVHCSCVYILLLLLLSVCFTSFSNSGIQTFNSVCKKCILFYFILFMYMSFGIKPLFEEIGSWNIPLECECMSIEWMFYISVRLLFSFFFSFFECRPIFIPFYKRLLSAWFHLHIYLMCMVCLWVFELSWVCFADVMDA